MEGEGGLDALELSEGDAEGEMLAQAVAGAVRVPVEEVEPVGSGVPEPVLCVERATESFTHLCRGSALLLLY